MIKLLIWLQQNIEKIWYQPKFSKYLWPFFYFSFIFALVIKIRRYYFTKVKVRKYFKLPIVVVGNLYVGGSGKTPCVLSLVTLLQNNNIRVGVISRGYKAKLSSKTPYKVTKVDDYHAVGDENVLLANSGAIVVICKSKVAAAYFIIENYNVDIIISDDGLQHYNLKRDIEIALYNEDIPCNGWLLPLGPLREPLSRLNSVDWVLNSKQGSQWKYKNLYNLHNPEFTVDITYFFGKTVQAVAGIANPQRFFDKLLAHGIKIIKCKVSDHEQYPPDEFHKEWPIIMTDKDAVKYRNIEHKKNIWVLPVEYVLSEQFKDSFIKKIKFYLKEKAMNKKLLDILVCPICKGNLIYKPTKDELICKIDKLAFQVKDDIPVMLESEARECTHDEIEDLKT